MAATTTRIRVLIIDDHELVSSALGATFAEDGRTEIVGMATSIADGLRAAAETQPDVILTDRRLPDGDMDQHLAGLRLASPSSRILMMTGWFTERSSLAALDAGAQGIVSKAQPVAQILEAIVRVVAGDLVVPASVTRLLVERAGRSEGGRRHQLSRRELDVLEGLACGESAPEISRRLCISAHTVRNHVAGAMLKLQAHDRLSAVAQAIQLGLVAPRLPGTVPPVERAAS
jgi:DNA-binding NarL/FixJ family response regulator